MAAYDPYRLGSGSPYDSMNTPPNGYSSTGNGETPGAWGGKASIGTGQHNPAYKGTWSYTQDGIPMANNDDPNGTPAFLDTGPSGRQLDVDRYRQMGANSYGSPAPQIQYGAADATRGAGLGALGTEGSALGLEMSAAKGGAPSQAERLGQGMIDQSLQAQVAAAGSVKGGPMQQQAAVRAAAQAGAVERARGVGQLSALRAEEMDRARTGAMAGAGQLAVGYANVSGQDAARAQAQADLEMRQRLAAQQNQQYYENLAYGVNSNQLQSDNNALGRSQGDYQFQQNQALAQDELQQQKVSNAVGMGTGLLNAGTNVYRAANPPPPGSQTSDARAKLPVAPGADAHTVKKQVQNHGVPAWITQAQQDYERDHDWPLETPEPVHAREGIIRDNPYYGTGPTWPMPKSTGIDRENPYAVSNPALAPEGPLPEDDLSQLGPFQTSDEDTKVPLVGGLPATNSQSGSNASPASSAGMNGASTGSGSGSAMQANSTKSPATGSAAPAIDAAQRFPGMQTLTALGAAQPNGAASYAYGDMPPDAQIYGYMSAPGQESSSPIWGTPATQQYNPGPNMTNGGRSFAPGARTNTLNSGRGQVGAPGEQYTGMAPFQFSDDRTKLKEAFDAGAIAGRRSAAGAGEGAQAGAVAGRDAVVGRDAEHARRPIYRYGGEGRDYTTDPNAPEMVTPPKGSGPATAPKKDPRMELRRREATEPHERREPLVPPEPTVAPGTHPKIEVRPMVDEGGSPMLDYVLPNPFGKSSMNDEEGKEHPPSPPPPRPAPMPEGPHDGKDMMADANRRLASQPYTYRPEFTPPEQEPGEMNYGPMAQNLEGNPISGSVVKKDPQGMRMLDNNKLLKVHSAGIAHLQNQIDELKYGT